MTAETIASALGRYIPKSGGGFMACCPAHNDKTPSLAIDEKNGALLVKCFAGCGQGEVIDALKARSLWLGDSSSSSHPRRARESATWKPISPVPEAAPSPCSKHRIYGNPAMTWNYLSQTRELLQLVYRFDTGNGKKVLPLTYCTNGTRQDWRWQGLPEPRPLYGLELIGEGEEIIVVEGEKAADAARRLLAQGAQVVTWSGGCNAVTKTNWSPLAGKRVALWPDADAPGIKAMLAVATELEKIGTAVKIVEPLQGVVPGWDLADAESEGWDRNRVLTAIAAGLAADEFRRKYVSTSKVEQGSSVVDEDLWEEPVRLPDGLLPVDPFDYDLLPDTLRPWAQDICERIQCPPDFVAVGIMAGLGSLIGRKVGIRPQVQTDWTVAANQWALVVGRPGVMKSPALEQALAPLNKLAAKANEDYATAIADHEAAVRVAKLRLEAAEKRVRQKLKADPTADIDDLLNVDSPVEPTLRRYSANDTTSAALGELLRQNQNGLLVYRDEMVSLLKSLDREDQAEGRGFYLTGWNGDSGYTFDRIGRGMNLHIPAVCLSLLGGTQPGRLEEYVRHAIKGGTGDDGLLQRFGLLVWPDIGGKWKDVDRWPNGEAKQNAFEVFEQLVNFDSESIGAQQDTNAKGEPEGMPYLRFSDEGGKLFLEWRTELERRIRSDELPPALESHFAKYRKLIPGLALILHLASGGTGPVSEYAVLQALGWSEYLEGHAQRAYGSLTQPETAAAKAVISRIRKGDLRNGFSSRDVWRPGWKQLTDREQVMAALRLLVDFDWLREEVNKNTGGRPATSYLINPGVGL